MPRLRSKQAVPHPMGCVNKRVCARAPWLLQMIQLLACDLLLSLRTSLWQKQANASQALGETYHASAPELTGFQRDLGSLRKLAHGFRHAYRKVTARVPCLQLSYSPCQGGGGEAAAFGNVGCRWASAVRTVCGGVVCYRQPPCFLSVGEEGGSHGSPVPVGRHLPEFLPREPSAHLYCQADAMASCPFTWLQTGPVPPGSAEGGCPGHAGSAGSWGPMPSASVEHQVLLWGISLPAILFSLSSFKPL